MVECSFISVIYRGVNVSYVECRKPLIIVQFCLRRSFNSNPIIQLKDLLSLQKLELDYDLSIYLSYTKFNSTRGK